MTKGEHRYVAGTKAARRGAARNGRIVPVVIDDPRLRSRETKLEIDTWNRDVEARKAAKKGGVS